MDICNQFTKHSFNNAKNKARFLQLSAVMILHIGVHITFALIYLLLVPFLLLSLKPNTGENHLCAKLIANTNCILFSFYFFEIKSL